MKRFATHLHKHPRVRPAMVAVLLFAWLLPPNPALALDPSRDFSQYNCRTWNRQNGLPGDGISAIAQTKDGYLWLGTAAGLVRFDGTGFKLLDLTRERRLRIGVITSLASSRRGGLWIGFQNSAVGYYDEHSFSFRGRRTWGGVDANVHALGESKDGTLWVAAERGAFRLTPADGYENLFFTFTNLGVNVVSGYEDWVGRLWFGTASQGVFCWEAGKTTRLSNPALNAITAVAQDLDGQMWFGTSSGLKCYDANLRQMEIPPLIDTVRTLLVDRHGILWIGTDGDGLVRFQNGSYTFLRKADGLAGDYVTALAEDASGNLWVGTRDGVSQLSDVKFPTLPAAENTSLKDATSVAASPRGGVWVGSAGGATYHFDSQLKTYSTEAGLPLPFVKRVFEAGNGDVYLVCGMTNLAILSGGKIVAKYAAPDQVVGMAEDAQSVVVSIGGELYRAGTNFLTPYRFAGDAPDLWWILNLAQGHDGTIWVGGNNGICHITGDKFQQWTAKQGLSDSRVEFLMQDTDGAVWAAMLTTGVARLKNNQIKCISRQDGLFDNNICAIVPDDFGNFWMDSGRGIFRVSRKNLNDFADGKTNRVECVAYDGPESVKSADKTWLQEHSGCKSRDGRIWFPSANGVVVIDPAHIPTNPVAPPVFIDQVRANGTEFAGSNHIVVPPGPGELEFHFSAVNFIAPQKTHFRYRLTGFDNDWVDAGDRRVAQYANLKPGRYQFRVIAANGDDVWSTTGAAMEITLRPHYYQTAWFYGLCGGLACAALAGIYLGRVRHLERKQQALQTVRDLLETQVQKRTEELARANTSLKQEIAGHKLTTVQLEQRTRSLENEIEERKRMQSENERVHRQLLETSREAGMAEVATSVLHNVGNVLNSVNVSAGLLADHLRKSKIAGVARVAALLEENRGDPAGLLAQPERAEQIIHYLKALAQRLGAEQAAMRDEIRQLTANIEHIKEIVAMQQGYARVSGVTEAVNPVDLVEDSLRISQPALTRVGVQLVREFGSVPVIVVEKNKVLQILVNLIRNAAYACEESGRPDKRLTLQMHNGDGRVHISVADNGVGIPAENLTRIFNHGFTTRKNGHGFGLHSGALAARELGGSLTAHSDGPGVGARFVLELPAQPPQNL